MENDRDSRTERLTANLISYTKAANPGLRQAAYAALGRVATEEAVECLLIGMDDENPRVRETAGRALARLVDFCSIYGFTRGTVAI